jgi:cytochrome c
LLQVPGHTAAVLTFRGHVRGRDLVERKKQELVALLAVSNSLHLSHCHMNGCCVLNSKHLIGVVPGTWRRGRSRSWLHCWR